MAEATANAKIPGVRCKVQLSLIMLPTQTIASLLTLARSGPTCSPDRRTLVSHPKREIVHSLTLSRSGPTCSPLPRTLVSHPKREIVRPLTFRGAARPVRPSLGSF